MITAIYDVSNTTWSFIEEQPFGLHFGFSDGSNETVVFDNLSFGWNIEINGTKTEGNVYPSDGEIYRQATASHRFYEPVRFLPDDSIVLNVWAKNGGIKVSSQFSFIVPKPEKPYPSWVWVDGFWEAPAPYPDDEEEYVWDEDNQVWATIDPISEQGAD